MRSGPRPQRRERVGGVGAVRGDALAQPGPLPGVRRQDHGRAGRAQRPQLGGGDQVQGRGVGDQGRLRPLLERGEDAGPAPPRVVLGVQAGAGHPGVRARRLGPLRRDQRLGVGGEHQVPGGLRAGVVHHARARLQRARAREHGGPRVALRSGDDGHHAARVLVGLGRGGRVGGPCGGLVHHAQPRGRRRRQVRSQPDVHHVHGARARRPLPEDEAGLEGAERHGRVRGQGLPPHLAGVRVHAGGHVARQHERVRRQGARRGGQLILAGEARAEHAVHHERGLGRHRVGAASPGRSQRSPALGVPARGAVVVPADGHGDRGHAPAAQEGEGEQRVPAVVAGADEGGHGRPGHGAALTQQGGGVLGQGPGGGAHQLRAAAGREQGLLGRAHGRAGHGDAGQVIGGHADSSSAARRSATT